MYFTILRKAVLLIIACLAGLQANQVFAQATGAVCSSAIPFCTGTNYNFPNNINVPSLGGGGAFGCLGSTPNPVWYYMQIANPGTIGITLSQHTASNIPIDVDFILWGPFSSVADACSNYSAQNIVDCSYSSSAFEHIDIPGNITATGQIYLLLLTNFSNTAGNITFASDPPSASNPNPGTTNCAVVCNITGLTATTSPCDPITNEYSLSGTVTVTAPPTTGWLTISTSCGQSIGISAPFTSPISYTMPDINVTAGPCTLTAQFSDNPSCTFSQTYVPPPPCNVCWVTATNTGPVCSGGSLNLSATSSNASTYSWVGPSGFNSTQQNPAGISVPATPGTYTYSVTATGTTSSCVATATTTVTVNPVPAAPAATSNSPVCIGQTLQLSASTIAGATYSWVGPGISAPIATQQNPAIANAQPVHAGTYSVFATVGGCTSAAGTISVAVQATPSAPVVTNSGPVCEGQPLQLSANGQAGAVYTWSGPGIIPAVANQQYPLFAAATLSVAGTYSVTYTVPGGCPSGTGTTNVVVTAVPAAPAASNSGPVCAGTTLQLSASMIAGAGYSWAGPGITASLAGQQNPAISPVAANMSGTYSVFAIVNGCTSFPGITQATVQPAPASPLATSNSPLCEGQALQLSASAAAGADYSWVGPGITASLAAQQNPVFANATASLSGSYTVYALQAGCVSAGAPVAVLVAPVPATPVAISLPVCEGGTLVLSATGSVGASYSWVGTGITPANATQQNPSVPNATLAMAGTYSVYATVSGCSSLPGISQAVIYPAPAAPGVSYNGPVCEGQTLHLSAQGPAAAAYSWFGPGIGQSDAGLQTVTIPDAVAAMSGAYSVLIIDNGCPSVPAVLQVAVSALPPAQPVLVSSTVSVGETLVLTAVPVPGATYSWAGPLAVYTGQELTIDNSQAGHFGTYTLTVTSQPGCQSSAQITVAAVPLVVPPNIFTPNADGINDTWFIPGLQEKSPQAVVQVFSRWGKKVFESKGYPDPWDGTSDGKPLPAGIYFYLVDPGNGQPVLTGHVTLVR